MLRILSFLLIVLALALGFSWLQDHPGVVSLTLGSAVMETSFTVFVVLQLLLISIICALVLLVRGFFKAPDRIGRFFSTRRRDKGYQALSTGILAAGAGDAVTARRMTKRSQKFLPARREPLVRFLDAQTAMIEGDHDRARAVFQSMEGEPETRLLAMRGLYLEAERLGDAAAARHYAERAARLAPHVSWAGGAVLESKTIEGDYDGALAILEAQSDARLIEKADSARMRAVILTAKARTLLDTDPAQARKAALEAVSLAPAFVPAAVTAARAVFRQGDLRKGSRILEKAWEKSPHPELATTYIHARPGDSALERLRRARALASLQPTHVETHIVMAHAAIDAGDLTLARIEANHALNKDPREGVFLLQADLEEAGGGSEGAVREWLARAVRAQRDPAWTADGVIAEEWAPVSPVTGRLDAFEWKVPARLVDATGTAIEGERSDARERLLSRFTESTGENGDGARVVGSSSSASIPANGANGVHTVTASTTAPATPVHHDEVENASANGAEPSSGARLF